MLSTKRLLYVISVVLVISTIFMLYNINEERASHISIERSADPVVSAMPDQNWEGAQQLTFVLTGESKREIYGDLYQNVRRLLDDLKLPVEATDFVDFASLDTNTIVIFCSDAISDYADLYQLGQFVENGGRVIFLFESVPGHYGKNHQGKLQHAGLCGRSVPGAAGGDDLRRLQCVHVGPRAPRCQGLCAGCGKGSSGSVHISLRPGDQLCHQRHIFG